MSDWIALGSLVVAIAAWWRSGRAHALALRTGVFKDATDLRLALDDLSRKIPSGLQSRERVSAALGRGGALEQFRAEAHADAAEVGQLLARLAGIPAISTLATYGKVEEVALELRAIAGRVQQLAAKYAAAWDEDEASRQHIRDAMIARIAPR